MAFKQNPFVIDVPEALIADLNHRLRATRWPDQVDGAGWLYGTELVYLQSLASYWQEGYDWRHHEKVLNSFSQFTVDIEGTSIHFVHVKGKADNSLPLVLTHGWPSSFVELVDLIGPLTDPGSFGADPSDCFDVVIPSMPGFGFSEAPRTSGQPKVDRIWRKLMTDVLGYESFVAHGTDVGARITSCLGRFHGDVVRAIHIGSVDLEWPSPTPPEAELSLAERQYLASVRGWEEEEGGYAHMQSTRPQTLAYALNDSPVGLASWIVEKYRAWSDCDGEIESRISKDQMLTNIFIYWMRQNIGSSMRRYYEVKNNPAYPKLEIGERIETPTGISMFPGERELVVPREWAERCYNVTYWSDMPRGGHFPALEEPSLLLEELRVFFREFR